MQNYFSSMSHRERNTLLSKKIASSVGQQRSHLRTIKKSHIYCRIFLQQNGGNSSGISNSLYQLTFTPSWRIKNVFKKIYNCKLGILDCSADNEGQIAIFCFFISYLGNRLKPAETVKETFFTCKMYSRVGTILYAQYAVPKTFSILSKIQAHLRKELRNKFYFSA